MFTFVQSAAAKLATHNSRSVVTPVESRIIIGGSYDSKFYEDLARRLRAIESQDHTLLDNVWSIGRRVFGQSHSIRYSTCPA